VEYVQSGMVVGLGVGRCSGPIREI